VYGKQKESFSVVWYELFPFGDGEAADGGAVSAAQNEDFH